MKIASHGPHPRKPEKLSFQQSQLMIREIFDLITLIMSLGWFVHHSLGKVEYIFGRQKIKLDSGLLVYSFIQNLEGIGLLDPIKEMTTTVEVRM